MVLTSPNVEYNETSNTKVQAKGKRVDPRIVTTGLGLFTVFQAIAGLNFFATSSQLYQLKDEMATKYVSREAFAQEMQNLKDYFKILREDIADLKGVTNGKYRNPNQSGR